MTKEEPCTHTLGINLLRGSYVALIVIYLITLIYI